MLSMVVAMSEFSVLMSLSIKGGLRMGCARYIASASNSGAAAGGDPCGWSRLRYSLAALTRTRNPRRPQIDLRHRSTLAADLYRSAYLPVVQVWERAIPTIAAEYERTLANLTIDAYGQGETGSVTMDSSGVRIRLTAPRRSAPRACATPPGPCAGTLP